LNFADRLSAAVAERESQVVLGLDPDPMRLLPEALESARRGPPAELAAGAIATHCRKLVEAAGEACVAVKLQLACFERLGAPGWQALGEVAALARDAGLLVVADGKRGDVPHTASAYAQALTGSTPTPWGTVEGLGADAVTANPLLGSDALEPIVSAARASGAGTFVLVRSSNAGAAELLDAGDGLPLHLRLARLVNALGAEGIGRCGLSDIGAVVGATEPRLIETLRSEMPQAVFLLPGVGAQGGRIDELRPAFTRGRAAALVAASRSIVDPAVQSGDVGVARAEAERVRDAAWNLSA
jgi:orotidine-5'-phosphate decarboxylase